VSRLNSVLQLVLVAAVLAVAFVVWRADQHAQDDHDRLVCLQRLQTIASISLMAPAASVDADGRLKAMQTLSSRIDKC
jgi:hypothetical protein